MFVNSRLAVTFVLAVSSHALCSQPQQPTPGQIRVCSTTYATDDIVIAAFGVTEFGATAGGQSDNTVAFQNAIDACHKAGGGVVFVPAGRYRIEGRLDLKSGVTLRGDWRNPEDATTSGIGTLLCVFYGRGLNDLAEPFVQMHNSTGLKDLAFWYPDQNVSSPVPYAFTIAQKGGKQATVENVTLINSYRGIRLGPTANELFTARDVYITALNVGFRRDQVYDCARLHRIRIKPKYWAESGLPNAPAAEEQVEELKSYMLASATGAVISHYAWTWMYDWEIESCHVGIETRRSWVKTKNRGPNGGFVRLRVIDCQTAMIVGVLNPQGWAVTDARIASDISGSVGVRTVPGFEMICLLHSVTFGGKLRYPLYCEGRTGTVSLFNCTFEDWADDGYAIYAPAGTVQATQCAFQCAKNHLFAGERVKAFGLLGNSFAGGLQLTDEAPAQPAPASKPPTNNLRRRIPGRFGRPSISISGADLHSGLYKVCDLSSFVLMRLECAVGSAVKVTLTTTCLLIWALGAPRAIAEEEVIPRVIFDSDMSSDWDDVGDAAVLHGLASMGHCEIIGMMVSSHNGATPLCMDAINTYYGKPDIPVGVRPDIGGIGEYAGHVAARFPHELKSAKDCPLAVDLYRILLAAQPDKSVIIATTGYLNNLQALLQSGPDQYSPLDGKQLVRKKVKVWACAGGAYPKGNEFNFRVQAAAAHYVVNNWPTAATFTPFSVGQVIHTGKRLPEAPKNNPIRGVYVDIKKKYPYPSWGQIAIYQAVRGSRGLWGEVNVGRNNAKPDGFNYWTDTPDPTGADDQAYLLEIARTPVGAGLDALIMLPPNDGKPSKPGEPSDVRATAVGSNRIDLQWTDNAFNESGFIIERKVNGAYRQIAKVGADATRYCDRGLSSTANTSYRVKAHNAVGDSIYAYVWYYTGWTESSVKDPGGRPLYTYYQHNNLRWARGGDFRPDHVVLNNDSDHGPNVTINVDVGALGAQGNFCIYFFYRDRENWYRLNFGEQSCQFEKRVSGTTSQIGPSARIKNLGNGSPLRAWRVEVTASGTLEFIQDGAPVLKASDTLSLSGGKIGLGGYARTPVWENFHFDLGSSAAPEKDVPR